MIEPCLLFLDGYSMLDICKSHCLLLSFKQRIGYLAASQSFHEDLDILMLTTNMIRKVSDNSLVNIISLFACTFIHDNCWFTTDCPCCILDK